MSQSHPDCPRCNNRTGKPYTPAEFMATLPPDETPRLSLAEEWGDDIAKAAVEVDVLVEEFDRSNNEWTAAERRAANAPRDEASKLAGIAAAFRDERERSGERLSKARADYHRLMGEASRQRQAAKYNSGVEAQLARIEGERADARERLRPETKSAH